MINEWAAHHDKREAMRILQEAGVPAAAVFDTLELAQDEHLNKNGTFVTVDHPERGSFLMCGSAIRMSDSRVPVVAASTLGQHTREILTGLLGMDSEKVSELIRAGVTADHDPVKALA
jgi:formyl-CoA transferase